MLQIKENNKEHNIKINKYKIDNNNWNYVIYNKQMK